MTTFTVCKNCGQVEHVEAALWEKTVTYFCSKCQTRNADAPLLTRLPPGAHVDRDRDKESAK